MKVIINPKNEKCQPKTTFKGFLNRPHWNIGINFYGIFCWKTYRDIDWMQTESIKSRCFVSRNSALFLLHYHSFGLSQCHMSLIFAFTWFTFLLCFEFSIFHFFKMLWALLQTVCVLLFIFFSSQFMICTLSSIVCRENQRLFFFNVVVDSYCKNVAQFFFFNC